MKTTLAYFTIITALFVITSCGNAAGGNTEVIDSSAVAVDSCYIPAGLDSVAVDSMTVTQ